MNQSQTRYFFYLLLLFFTSLSLNYGQVPDFSLYGFATLNGGTTGGEGGAEVIVSSFEELKLYAEDEVTPYIIYIHDTITGIGSIVEQDYQGSVSVASNKSILGLDGTAFLNGVGFTIKNHSNIIIKNLKICFISISDSIPEGSHDIPGIYSEFGDEGRAQILVNYGDLISIKGTSKNIWIDHCELYNEDPKIQTNIDLYDGLIDITHQSGFITISWCYFHDHHKVQLIGSTDTDLYPDRKITFHHNRYENVGSRLPFYRGAEGHVFNNYYNNILSSGVDCRLGACIRVEKNYFKNTKNPIISSQANGYAEGIDNIEDNCFYTKENAENCELIIPYHYKNILTTHTSEVKNLVIKYTGVGK